MFRFMKKKQGSDIVWRDSNGKIVCPGDSCPKKCDSSCPIWLNVKGHELMQTNQVEQAIESFRAALRLAPDYIVAQSNLGSAYAVNGQHQEAYDAFQKAYDMQPSFVPALANLTLVENHLELFEKALRHCTELEQLGFNALDLRQSILSCMKQKDADMPKSINLAFKLLDIGEWRGFIKPGPLANIPDIMIHSTAICKKILQAASSKLTDKARLWRFVLIWSAYAGMGAAYHWRMDCDALSRKGIYETLTAKRGLFEMDQYVMSTIGIPYESEKELKLRQFLNILASECIIELNLNEGSEDDLIVSARAMYLFGMTFLVNRL